jgi:hypothetical protein
MNPCYGLKTSPAGAKDGHYFIPIVLSPLPGRESSLANRGPRASRLPPDTFLYPFGAIQLSLTSDCTRCCCKT